MINNNEILYDLANESVRRYGESVENLTPKIKRRIQRKFKTNLDISTISTLIGHYKDIYKYAVTILEGFILPSTEEYASMKNIEITKFTGQISSVFPEEDPEIINTIARRVVYWEYLR